MNNCEKVNGYYGYYLYREIHIDYLNSESSQNLIDPNLKFRYSCLNSVIDVAG